MILRCLLLLDPDYSQSAGAPAQANIPPAAPPAITQPYQGGPLQAAPNGFVPPTQPLSPQQAAYLQQAAAPAPQVAQPAAPSPVQVAPEELARLYGVQKQYEEFQRVQAENARQAESARLMAEAEKGKVQEAFQEFQRKAQSEAEQLRNTLQAGELSRVVAEAVAGVTFASDEARKDAMMVLRSQVNASIDPTTGQVLVRDLSGRPALEALREMATSARFAHYRAPATQGGTAGQTFQARTPAPQQNAYQQGSHADVVNSVRAAKGLPPLDPSAMGGQGQMMQPPAQQAAPNGLVWRGG